jgi:PPP family 3-phenylpropionic acid transporter
MTAITPSAFYFLLFAANACLLPFLALYYKSIGLTGSQIGLLTGLSPLITLAAAPFWTGLADTTRRHKLVMAALMVVSATSALAILVAHDFFGLLLVVSVFAFALAPLGSLADTATMSMLGERRDRYGRIRIFGTLGWGVMAPVAGWIIKQTGLDWAFYLYAFLMSLGLLLAFRFTFPRDHHAVPFAQGMRTLFGNRHWMFFLGMVLLSGIGTATINTYLSVLLADLHASTATVGVALAISTISELPIMFFANRLLRRFHPSGVLVLAMIAVVVRVLLYSVAGAAWQVLLIQLLHGLNYPLIWVAGVAYADRVAPPGLNASAQGMFGSTLMGIGAAVGNLLGGVLLQQGGTAGMYRIIGLVVLAGLLLVLAVERLFGNARMGDD